MNNIKNSIQSNSDSINMLTHSIIGCAFKVYNTLGFGFLESVYEKSLLIELNKLNISTKAQEPIKVYYEDKVVGDYYADILIENKLILELKSVRQLAEVHEVQLVNYLKATSIENGLLINFGPEKVDVKRKFKTYSDK